MDWLASESGLRFVVSFGLLATLLLAAVRFPRRVAHPSQRRRWLGNVLVAIVNMLVMRLVPTLLLPGAVALWAAEAQFGVLYALAVPMPVAIIASLLILDLAIYWQHRLFHRIPLLWRLHRMHHTDVDVDTTTALRFHPLEILLSALIKSLLVLALGVPAVAVLVFEVLLNGMALFNHSNLKLPLAFDAWLRKWVVTPDMHRVHHSVARDEHDANFGFNLSCWDRWFGSYIPQPYQGHSEMILGLNETNQQDTGSVSWMLKQPFRGTDGN